MTPRELAVLRAEWPVERLSDAAPSDEVAALVESGLLYATPLGNGWTRFGVTSEGRRVLRHENRRAS